MPRLAHLVLALLLGGCGSGTAPVEGVLRVLFIGNSLTYTNDLPVLVAQLAASTGGAVTLDVRDVSQSGFALEDHWNLPATMDVLNQGGWDVVVLQQGPSSLPESQANLRQWSTTFAERVRALGGRPALYMVWPESTRLAAFDAVRDSYRAAAEAAGAELYPAGEAWRAAWRADPDLPFYGPDGFHPSTLGSYLAALTIFHGLARRPVVGLPAPGFDPQVAALLQRAAEEASAAFGIP